MKFTGYRQTPPPWAIELFSNVNDSLEVTRSVYRLRGNGHVFNSVFFPNKSSLYNVYLYHYVHMEELKQIATESIG